MFDVQKIELCMEKADVRRTLFAIFPPTECNIVVAREIKFSEKKKYDMNENSRRDLMHKENEGRLVFIIKIPVRFVRPPRGRNRVYWMATKMNNICV